MNPPKETRTAHYCPYYGNVLLEFHSNEQGKGCNCADIEYVVALDEPKGITAEEYDKRNKTFSEAMLETNALAEQFSHERIFDKETCQMKNVPAEKDTGAHYRFQLTQLVTEVDLQRGYVVINLDPYRIADVYGITNHAIFSALKKLLIAGGRGFKDTAQDVADSIGALQRWQEMQEEQTALANEVGKSLKTQETFVAPAVCTTIDRDKENLANLRAMQAGFSNPWSIYS